MCYLARVLIDLLVFIYIYYACHDISLVRDSYLCGIVCSIIGEYKIAAFWYWRMVP